MKKLLLLLFTSILFVSGAEATKITWTQADSFVIGSARRLVSPRTSTDTLAARGGGNIVIIGSTVTPQGDIQLDDNIKARFGTGVDAYIYYDATNLRIEPNAVGSGVVQIDGGLTAVGDFSSQGGTTIGNASGDALTFHPSAWTLTNAVTITGTWTNLGTVTTVDINGGTGDAFVIGGSTAAAGTFTTLKADSTWFGAGDFILAPTQNTLYYGGNVGFGIAATSARIVSSIAPSLGVGLEIYDPSTMAQYVGNSIAFTGNSNGTGSIGTFASISGLKENGTVDNYQGVLLFYTNTTGAVAGGLGEKMRITSFGNVGIGDSDPSNADKLSIYSNVAHSVPMVDVHSDNASATGGGLALTYDGTGLALNVNKASHFDSLRVVRTATFSGTFAANDSTTIYSCTPDIDAVYLVSAYALEGFSVRCCAIVYQADNVPDTFAAISLDAVNIAVTVNASGAIKIKETGGFPWTGRATVLRIR